MTRARPLVMGILNVTPDSFSDGGRYFDTDRAVRHGLELAAEGADIIDVGGESTRPGADEVSTDDETARVVPVIERLSTDSDVRLSVDTTKPDVARAAIAAGASLINDVSATLHEVAAETGAGWVAMHRRGDPKSMQRDPTYDDVVGEVEAFLADRAVRAKSSGVDEVWIDPGFGFGKTFAHNLALLKHIGRFCALGARVVVGVSRKRLTAELTAASDGRPVDQIGVHDRLEASLTAATWAMDQGAGMVRAHDVRPTLHAARVVAGS